MHLVGAIKTIIIADAVMSLDNVLAVAGAAGGNLYLVSFGILISIPIIVWGSQLVLALMERFPVVILFGGGLLGWIAGGMAISDNVIKPYLSAYPQWLHYASSAAGALSVVGVAFLISKCAAQPQQLGEDEDILSSRSQFQRRPWPVIARVAVRRQAIERRPTNSAMTYAYPQTYA